MRLGGSCSTSAVRRSGRKQRRWSVDDCRGAGVSCVALPAYPFRIILSRAFPASRIPFPLSRCVFLRVDLWQESLEIQKRSSLMLSLRRWSSRKPLLAKALLHALA